ncbi:Signal-transduction histidine kinase senX3 [Maioricimonas rarisocia]|uniref:histidine kinase n=1 Tax=Maioricimonas rarisocia TaxID=2528026 RepID=A0A517Z4A1_9PLAN|nr:HAMP domain-containing sensor histidine kinase [Maioricimonas rarisocia]QDU37312.1 Signal-transduction histidine kinase senX3 [Maioricimonas rarisocia]
MAVYFRKRSTLHLPVTLSVSLMVLNVTLMVCWIILLAQRARWTALTVGVVAFTLILLGLSLWLALTIKEVRLNQRQANFVDSVTHELKSPIAALQLYLETLRMRSLDEEKRQEFHAIMAVELSRLDQLISHLLEVGRLDAIGMQEESEDVRVDLLVRQAVANACVHHKLKAEEVITLDLQPMVMHTRRLVLEMIFSNLVDNAIKYADDDPQVRIELTPYGSSKSRMRIWNNGVGVPFADRKKIFQIFYRGGNELTRRRTGTGLGLYIVYTLVRKLKGRVSVVDRPDGASGCVFDVELPGCLPAAPDSEAASDSDRASREKEELRA